MVRRPSARALPAVVCTIGSTDPLSAAGIAADLHVYRALSLQATLVVTAVTAQNSRRVSAIQTLPPAIIRQQLESVWDQVQPLAINVGLIPHAAGLRAVREFLSALKRRPAIVVDPVWRASSGQQLSTTSARPELLRLLPLATVVTPNALELEMLTGQPIANIGQAQTAAFALSSSARCAVLFTGGHLVSKNVTDILVHRNVVRLFSTRRVKDTMRGMGGVLAAAVCGYLARSEPLDAAITHARALVQRALSTAQPLGRGARQLFPAQDMER